MACDADGDGDCEQDDINAMYAAFGTAGMFDYDGSGSVDAADIPGWLAEASTPQNAYNTGKLKTEKRQAGSEPHDGAAAV